MAIVLGNLNKIELGDDDKNMVIIHSEKDIERYKENKAKIMVISKMKNLELFKGSGDKIYIPSTMIKREWKDKAYVYFELEQYAFFQKLREILTAEMRKKGVLRFRRLVNSELDQSIILSDFYAFSTFFGECEVVQVKRTSNTKGPIHVILAATFSENVLAHLEYTFLPQEKETVALEWSGVKNILELNSNEMDPLLSNEQTNQPLDYSLSSIIKNSHLLNEDLIGKWDQLNQMLFGNLLWEV